MHTMNESMTVIDAIGSRRSIRAFLPDPVERSTLEAIFGRACRAPSGSNVQPWKVHVLTGEVKEAVSRAILAAFNDPGADRLREEEFAYHPRTWSAPVIERHSTLGIGLDTLLGVTREHREGMRAQMARNFSFFGAPVGIIFSTDRTMQPGAWLDCGMLMQNIMLMARAYGLDTCPQAAFSCYRCVIAEQLKSPENDTVIGGMSLGYADWSEPDNRLKSGREPLEGSVRFLGP